MKTVNCALRTRVFVLSKPVASFQLFLGEGQIFFFGNRKKNRGGGVGEIFTIRGGGGVGVVGEVFSIRGGGG